MNAYVAVTDADWYGFLSRQEDLDGVKFWQPNPWGGELGVLRRGEPLLFKLKAPHNAIAGVGFFERYVTLPFSLAWDAFGVKNGAAPERWIPQPPSFDGESYLRLHGQTISVTDRDEERPSPEFLRWHNEERYRG